MYNSNIVSPVISYIKTRMKRGKIVSVDDAVRVIQDGDTVALDGFLGACVAEELIVGIADRFKKNGEPKNLTLIYASGIGDGKDKSINHLAQEGFVKLVIAGHWGLPPQLQTLTLNNKIEAYNFPQDVLTHLFRDIAANNPRTISRVGLGTYVDRRNSGGIWLRIYSNLKRKRGRHWEKRTKLHCI